MVAILVVATLQYAVPAVSADCVCLQAYWKVWRTTAFSPDATHALLHLLHWRFSGLNQPVLDSRFARAAVVSFDLTLIIESTVC